MHRSILPDGLLAAAKARPRIKLAVGKEVVRIEDSGSSAKVTCADGSRYSAKLVIGADGLRSLVRAVVADEGEPKRSPFVAYRGTWKRHLRFEPLAASEI
jgi:2-polyprenyl-6-methoxyphenol hydroxylase-like FAD-dependent oxidoreductase